VGIFTVILTSMQQHNGIPFSFNPLGKGILAGIMERFEILWVEFGAIAFNMRNPRVETRWNSSGVRYKRGGICQG